MGLFTALAIAIHNFPEGLATFLAALEDPSLGVAIAIAIALHNIPEGISVSVPIFYATGNRKKAFFWSFMSGLAEPIGAILAYAAIRYFVGGESGVIPSNIMGILFSSVAGIMVYISLDELLPTSRAYGKGHDSLRLSGRHGNHGTQSTIDAAIFYFVIFSKGSDEYSEDRWSSDSALEQISSSPVGLTSMMKFSGMIR